MAWPARCLAIGGVAGLIACKDGPSEPAQGPPAALVLVSGAYQSAFGNTQLSQPIRLSVRDANGRGVPGAPVTFEVARGGGALIGSPTTVSDESGEVTAPGWQVGKSAVAQMMRASSGSITTEITATVATSFDIVVRFYGSQPVSPEHQQLFANAVARVRGIVTGDLIAVNALNSGVALDEMCGVTGQPRLSEVIDDVIIFAAIQSIDGPGRILAQAGPCLVRSGANAMTAVGVMSFDSADLGLLSQGAALQEVITHEIIHVLGFGTLWSDRGFIADTGSSDPRYTGPRAREGCVAVGLVAMCAASIPVEAGGGPGTALSHWRESTFASELLTGYYSAGGNPLSSMTIGSLADLGFVVNGAAGDSYANTGAAQRGGGAAVTLHPGWEHLKTPAGVITPQGVLRRTR